MKKILVKEFIKEIFASFIKKRNSKKCKIEKLKNSLLIHNKIPKHELNINSLKFDI